MVELLVTALVVELFFLVTALLHLPLQGLVQVRQQMEIVVTVAEVPVVRVVLVACVG
jgi:hypothetical protein